ncbi:hypothetical protein ACTAQI_06255 [Pseudarthrobacter sp. alpha12b]
MQWDLGPFGVAVLASMAIIVGGLFRVIVGRTSVRWLWFVAAVLYFVAGILVSEVWFAWATGADLQPNIDGLSFDEVNLVTLVGLIAAVAIRFVLRQRHSSAGSANTRAQGPGRAP